VIFQETSLPIVADRQRKLSPPGTSCPRWESKRRDIEG
jgi:hypothetical protein